MKRIVPIAVFLVASALILLPRAEAAAPKVFFKNLKDGAKVTSPVKVEMGVEGMTVANAGSLGETEGHHHIIVDGAPIDKGQPVPADATHIHFGKGQTEASVELPPGKH